MVLVGLCFLLVKISHEEPDLTLDRKLYAAAESQNSDGSYSDLEDVKCGTPGFLYTTFQEGEEPIWKESHSSSWKISVNSSVPKLVGLAGSFIPQETRERSFSVSVTEPVGFHLEMDCFNETYNMDSSSSFHTPYILVTAGYRYKFIVMTTLPFAYVEVEFSLWGDDIQ
jgi:hypothetical protein